MTSRPAFTPAAPDHVAPPLGEPARRAADADRDAVRALLEAGRIEEALHAAFDLVEARPAHPASAALLARCLLAAGDPEGAAAEIGLAINLLGATGEPPPRPWLRLAAQLRKAAAAPGPGPRRRGRAAP